MEDAAGRPEEQDVVLQQALDGFWEILQTGILVAPDAATAAIAATAATAVAAATGAASAATATAATAASNAPGGRYFRHGHDAALLRSFTLTVLLGSVEPSVCVIDSGQNKKRKMK